jgi:serine/threonine-protein kinase
VFVARDEELHREVALKEIQERFADQADSRSRFIREAEITGHLEHPGVVPIYGLGAYPDGRPFYAMRFIRGESMKEAIERFHAPQARRLQPLGFHSLVFRELLERFVAVCNAVAYAHSRGVIHRDLKPANVMLGEYGETLVVDWGLARLIAQHDPEATTAAVPIHLSAGNGSTATEMGQVVGTPAYMPPEQALGKVDELGPASDVFALGAILYNVLTGKPPYRGKADEVLEQAKHGQALPPRQRHPGVPRALEAVCTRAMSVSPEDRYADVRSLAAEVRRWLADEPVQAYREPVPDRLRRWSRRHRTLVSVGVSLLAAGVVALGVGLWLLSAEQRRTAEQRDRAVEAEGRERQRRAEAEVNLERALTAEKQAQDNLKLARTAIDECYNLATTDPLFQEPRMEKAKNLLLRKTLPFYRNFRVRRPNDRALQFEEASQWYRVGDIEFRLRRTRQAREAYERARELHQALVKTHPNVAEYLRGLAGTHNNLAIVLSALGQREEAIKEYRQASDVKRKLMQAHPGVADYPNELAGTLSNLGSLLYALGRNREGLAEFRQALSLRKKLVKTHPERTEYQADLASMHNNLGYHLAALGRSDAALGEYQQAQAIQQKLVQDHPSRLSYQRSLAYTLTNLGNLLHRLGQRELALKQYEEVLQLAQKLNEVHPDLPAYQEELARTHNNMGAILRDLHRDKKALEQYQKALALRRKLAEAHPDLLDYQKQRAATHYNLGLLLRELQKQDEALAEYRQARAIQKKLLRAHPNLPEYQRDLGRTQGSLAVLLVERGKHAEALVEYQQARALFGKLVQAYPNIAEFENDLAMTHSKLGRLLTALGQREEACKEHERARELRKKLARAHPNRPDYQEDLVGTHNDLGKLLSNLGKRDEALTEHRQSRTLLRKLVESHPALPAYQVELATTYNNLAYLLRECGKTEEALREYERARTLQQKLVWTHPDEPEYQVGLAGTLCNRGNVLRESGKVRDSLAHYDQAIKLLQTVHQRYPSRATARLFLRNSHWGRAQALTILSRHREALADWDQTLRLDTGADRADLRLRRTECRARAGDYLRSAAEVEALAAVKGIPLATHGVLACIQSVNARTCSKDAGRPLPEREKRSEQYARAAVEMLRRAAAGGYFRGPKRIEDLDRDDDLAFLRGRDDYRALRKALSSRKP